MSAEIINANITVTNGAVHIIDNLLGFVPNDAYTQLQDTYEYRWVNIHPVTHPYNLPNVWF